jgi:hypothetical protein
LQYEEDSAPALALKATIERTEKRFATYGKQGLLCGTDGLPHLISDPGLAIRYGHAGETLVPPHPPPYSPSPKTFIKRKFFGVGIAASLVVNLH